MFIYKFSAGTKQAAKSNGYNTVLCAFEATAIYKREKKNQPKQNGPLKKWENVQKERRSKKGMRYKG